MIIGVYVKNTSNGLWHLFSTSISSEVALKDKENALKLAIEGGNKEAVAGVKVFSSIWLMPETLKDLKEDQKLLFN